MWIVPGEFYQPITSGFHSRLLKVAKYHTYFDNPYIIVSYFLYFIKNNCNLPFVHSVQRMLEFRKIIKTISKYFARVIDIL